MESPGTPWRDKEAHTLRLYAPNTAYWEAPPDDGDLRSETLCLMFLGGEIVGLGALLHPRMRYARFLDPEGIAERLIGQIVRLGVEDRAACVSAQHRFCGRKDGRMTGRHRPRPQ